MDDPKRRLLPTLPLHPGGRFKTVWNLLVLPATGYHLLVVPYALASGHVLGEIHRGDLLLYALISLFFAAGIFFSFHTAFLRDGQMETDTHAIRQRYLSGWFTLDLVATLPFDLLALLAGYPLLATQLSLLRLLRTPRLVGLFRGTTLLHGESIPLRLTMMLFWMTVILHIIGCLWLQIYEFPPEDSETTRYIKSIYWAVTTLASVGYGDITPTTNEGRLFAMLVMLTGVGFYSVVIGNVSMLLVNANAHVVRQKEKLAHVATFMHRYQIPPEVRMDVMSYFSHHLLEKPNADEEILDDLPDKLRENLENHIHIHVLRQTPLFRNISPPCLQMLASALKPMVFGPGETIIRVGETGQEMFFLMHGVVHILKPDGLPLVKLYRHSFFGELALLENVERTATVRAAATCDVMRLDREDFEHIMEFCPELKQELTTQSRIRLGTRPPQASSP